MPVPERITRRTNFSFQTLFVTELDASANVHELFGFGELTASKRKGTELRWNQMRIRFVSPWSFRVPNRHCSFKKEPLLTPCRLSLNPRGVSTGLQPIRPHACGPSLRRQATQAVVGLSGKSMYSRSAIGRKRSSPTRACPY